jgi:hypothetical protein
LHIHDRSVTRSDKPNQFRNKRMRLYDRRASSK